VKLKKKKKKGPPPIVLTAEMFEQLTSNRGEVDSPLCLCASVGVALSPPSLPCPLGLTAFRVLLCVVLRCAAYHVRALSNIAGLHCAKEQRLPSVPKQLPQRRSGVVVRAGAAAGGGKL
jgi:hypothetical protein